MFLKKLKNRKIDPPMSIPIPIILPGEKNPSVSDVVMNNVPPTKMLKKPLPAPVIINKKFLLTHVNPKVDEIIMQPKTL